MDVTVLETEWMFILVDKLSEDVRLRSNNVRYAPEERPCINSDNIGVA